MKTKEPTKVKTKRRVRYEATITPWTNPATRSVLGEIIDREFGTDFAIAPLATRLGVSQTSAEDVLLHLELLGITRRLGNTNKRKWCAVPRTDLRGVTIEFEVTKRIVCGLCHAAVQAGFKPLGKEDPASQLLAAQTLLQKGTSHESEQLFAELEVYYKLVSILGQSYDKHAQMLFSLLAQQACCYATATSSVREAASQIVSAIVEMLVVGAPCDIPSMEKCWDERLKLFLQGFSASMQL
jgi:hypothetical protein